MVPIQHHAVVIPPQALPDDVPRQHVVGAALPAVAHQHHAALHHPAAYRRQQPWPQPIGRPHRAEPPAGQRVPHPRRQIELHTSAPLYFPVKTAILYLIL